MEVNVAQLLKERTGVVRPYHLAGEELEVEGERRGVEGEVFLMRTDSGIWVSASLNVRTAQQCSRCLKPFPQPMAVSFEEEYFPVIDVNTGAALKVPHEGSFTIDHHHILDLREAVRQYALAVFPMKPLCSETCKGLCSHCGADLNKGACLCSHEAIDPRLLPLKQLLKGRR